MTGRRASNPGTGWEWYEAAACQGVDTDLFFPACGVTATRQIQAALAYCQRCPVTAACLTTAMAEERATYLHRVYGVRGGLTAADRKRLHGRHRKAAS